MNATAIDDALFLVILSGAALGTLHFAVTWATWRKNEALKARNLFRFQDLYRLTLQRTTLLVRQDRIARVLLLKRSARQP